MYGGRRQAKPCATGSWLLAIELGPRGRSHGDVPIGAVVARGDEVARRRPATSASCASDPTAHAEALALRVRPRPSAAGALPDTPST